MGLFLGVALVYTLLLHLFTFILLAPDLSFFFQMWESKD